MNIARIEKSHEHSVNPPQQSKGKSRITPSPPLRKITIVRLQRIVPKDIFVDVRTVSDCANIVSIVKQNALTIQKESAR